MCENHDYCYVEKPEKDNKILKYNYREKSMRAKNFICFNFKCLIEKINTCHNDPEKSSTTKVNKFTTAGYSLYKCASSDAKRNKLDCYRGKDCMKKFCEDLKKHAERIINYEKKEMIPLTKEEKDWHNNKKVCYICKRIFKTGDDNKKYHKVRGHCHYTGEYRGAAHRICNLRYNMPREISAIGHNASAYDYHLVIKELAKEFEGQFECLGENTEKYITFSIPIEKQLDNGQAIIYKIRFEESHSYLKMSSSLSSPFDNLSEGLHGDKCTDCKSYFDYMSIKDNLLIFRCFGYKKNYEKEINEELIKRFANIYEFCNNDINKFVLLLRKVVYPYEYMDSWERFDETSLPDKEAFYSKLNMEEITNADYRHANNVFKEFELKKLGEYHNLYVQSDILLLADVFENFRNIVY